MIKTGNVLPPSPLERPEVAPTPYRTKKVIAVALSAILAVGAIISYVLGSPWFLVFGFFTLSLSSLFYIGKAVNEQRMRILG